MPELAWYLTCDHAITDQTGKISIIGEFDTINAPSFPFTLPLFFIVTKWVRSPKETFRYRVNLVAPSGAQLLPPEDQAIPGHPEGGRANGVQGFIGTVFPEPGTYQIEILVDRVPIRVSEFHVNLAKR